MTFTPLPVGVDDFAKLRNNGYYYVDKTLLIKELLDYKGEVNLFTRPRRFGKTLNMSMLQYYFEKTVEDNGYLFAGLKIMEAGDKYSAYMGQYPVISLSLKSAKQPTFELAYHALKSEIIREYRRHKNILSDEVLSDEKELYETITQGKGKDFDFITSLQYLSICLEKYYRKKVIILIDEYDVPLENAYISGFYTEMVGFLRSLFESALKTNSSLEFAVLTGCLRISKESIFTGLNNLEITSILSSQYAEHFGFTEKEVSQMVKDYSIQDSEELIKQWYNGYLFGNIEVYNPWSVIRIIKDLAINQNVLFTSYWGNTSSNSIVRNMIEMATNVETREEIERLVSGDIIEKKIHEDITYDEIYSSMDNIWNFLFFTGYLKKVGQRQDDSGNIYISMQIPNKEIAFIFSEKVLGWFNEQIKSRDLTKMYEAILKGDALTFEIELEKLLMDTISFNDYYENFYHGFFLGSLMNLKDYSIISNRESGKGRSDIIIKYPSVRGKAVIFEIKCTKNLQELDKKCDEALTQIEEKSYAYELEQKGYKNIIKYGIAFCEKNCRIKIKTSTPL